MSKHDLKKFEPISENNYQLKHNLPKESTVFKLQKCCPKIRFIMTSTAENPRRGTP